MIDLERTQVLVTAWPDNRWPVEVFYWLERVFKDVQVRPDQRVSIKRKNVVCARNYAITVAKASHNQYEHFIFMDRDIRPGPKTARFLELDADVKCCQVKQREPDAWAWPDDFHESIWCTSREVLSVIEPPWFTHSYNADCTKMTACICQSFRAKVLAAGFSIAHGGWADHDRDESWC